MQRTRTPAARGSVDPNFEGGGEVRCIAMQPDGKIVVGAVGTSQNFVTRLTPTGTLDSSLNLELTGNDHEVRILVIQPDGKILVAGTFSAIGGTGRNGIARINAKGTLDPTVALGVAGIVRVRKQKID